MIAGENPDKVKNIVAGNLDGAPDFVYVSLRAFACMYIYIYIYVCVCVLEHLCMWMWREQVDVSVCLSVICSNYDMTTLTPPARLRPALLASAAHRPHRRHTGRCMTHTSIYLH
jgi:hypothetical protein